MCITSEAVVQKCSGESSPAWNAFVFSVFPVRISPNSEWKRRFKTKISAISPNAGKYGPGKTLNMDNFHAVESRRKKRVPVTLFNETEGLKTSTLLERKIQHFRVFLCACCKLFLNGWSIEYLWKTASGAFTYFLVNTNINKKVGFTNVLRFSD